MIVKFCRSSEIDNVHTQGIMKLLIISGTNPPRFTGLYVKLITHIKILDVMEKLKDIHAYVRLTLDKLDSMR